MRLGLVVVGAALFLGACAQMSAGNDPHDPLIWLEDVHGAKALDWVKQENARSDARFKADKRYETYRQEALAILTAQDRIAVPSFRAEGVDNLWQDDAHPHGLWRHTSAASYRSGVPQWTTVLDLDALSKAEGRNWFLKSVKCLPPEDRLCLLELSDGGGDAVEIREFDAEAKAFVASGFRLDRAKQDVEWIDQDTFIVSRAWTAGDATESGYPSVITYMKRG
jgi:prolyl oligopeptidase